MDFVALPHTDWAFSMLRQFLFDAYESIHVPSLMASRYEPIAEAAAKIKQEEFYHLYHTKAWVQRLGLGTDESRRRMQTALDQLWTPFQQLFAPGRGRIAARRRRHHCRFADQFTSNGRRWSYPSSNRAALVVPDDAVVPGATIRSARAHGCADCRTATGFENCSWRGLVKSGTGLTYH